MGVALSRHNVPDYQTQYTANTTSSKIIYNASMTPYMSFESGFISAIVGAAFLSAFSVIMLLVMNVMHPPSRLGDRTHIPLIFGSLIASNFVQSIGTMFDARWVSLGRVSPGTLCSLQGGIKQAGNVGTAVWSFALAHHAFNLLFLRARLTTRSKWITLAVGWTFIVFVVAIGPLAIQRKDLGPYFGPSGFWCWITGQYPASQFFLEYMLEWTSAFFSFLLYVIVLLRVRGNLIHDTAGKWSLQWIPRSESWQLGFVRDYLDSCTVRLAAIIVWYPVTYTVLIVPISIARFASYAGARVPHGFTFLADLIFALGGFANLLLFLGTRRFMPDVSTVPDFSTPRSLLDKDSPKSYGITPFLLGPREAEEKPDVMMAAVSDGEVSVSLPDTETEGAETPDPRMSVATDLSDASKGSMQPLNALNSRRVSESGQHREF